ncbi:F1F0 ATP synthase subunit I [Saccharomycopsis crataegensis]|uniref:F1F0 ATP synthase subunit I n=1 Tax=Saccharomycopsis crataegensis TaxID=43959 RepID=A0AAV5QVR5_9ASCO|nr:F1F0 ATP synthase subunit I [Saccharomycopsis crataegensis]
MKRYATPILKPYWPFFVGGGLTYYLVAKAANASANTEEFINDPRNPRFAREKTTEELFKNDLSIPSL